VAVSSIKPASADDDIGILFIETSGCLPMCGHGTIGIATFGLDHGFIRPRTLGRLVTEVPAGKVSISYEEIAGRVRSVRIRNVASYVVEWEIAH
jgi:4-hydroxyproline epimerase